MATDYPGALDTTKLTNPNTTDKTNSPSLAGAQANQNDAIKAVEAKVGTGASTPVVSTLLFGTGTGTSAWTQLTSAQLAASLSDETGTGKAVFGTSPTLITPAVDTINESTPGNGVTVAGVNIKSGVIQAPGTAIGQGNVSAAMLATSAITLASLTSSTTQTGISTSAVLVTGLTTTVTNPAGGRKVRIEGQIAYITSTLACTWYLYIYNSATVTGSPIQTVAQLQAINGAIGGAAIWFEHTPAAGSQSYCIAISCDSGVGNTSGLTATKLATMSVKVI